MVITNLKQENAFGVERELKIFREKNFLNYSVADQEIGVCTSLVNIGS